MFNLAYSAPRGYDLRAPYNVPMGEIQTLRVVDPFSTAAYQKDTITTALPRTCLGPSFSVARIIRCKQRHSQHCTETQAEAATTVSSLEKTKRSKVNGKSKERGSIPKKQPS